MADVASNTQPQGTEKYSLEEIARHTSEGDAWLVHSTKVYDVSKFLERHPGGQDILVKNCGKDVTEIMNSADFHKHSKIAYGWLQKYYIGKVKEEVGNRFKDFDLGWVVGVLENVLCILKVDVVLVKNEWVVLSAVII